MPEGKRQRAGRRATESTRGAGTSARHRFYVAPQQVLGGQVEFSAEQAYQLTTVLRMRVGEPVRVFDGVSEADLVVRLSRLSSRAAAGEIEGTQAYATEPRTQLTAYPALLGRDKLDQVLQKLVEVGVARIVPVRTARSIVRELPDGERRERWRRIVREAAEQSGRGHVPEVGEPRALAQALAEATATSTVLLAQEDEHARPLRGVLRQLTHRERLSIFVGPEGGYTAGEVAQARAGGARVVSLGPRALRTETASPVLAALILYELDTEVEP
ncbi:MAG: RsmE family RNA methyltransferase [Chloroflexi bacterium]|nr:RsmE family RNA methyltransferase [Chloroflexota bacterium]